MLTLEQIREQKNDCDHYWITVVSRKTGSYKGHTRLCLLDPKDMRESEAYTISGKEIICCDCLNAEREIRMEDLLTGDTQNA